LTTEVDATSVVQVIVAAIVEGIEATAEITGGGGGAFGVRVMLAVAHRAELAALVALATTVVEAATKAGAV